jgi:NTE family protein
MPDLPPHPIELVVARPSLAVGRLASEIIQSPSFRRRNGGLAGRLLRALASREPEAHAELSSYLLFDGEFAEALIALGKADARALAPRWQGLFAPQASFQASGLAVG